MKRYVALSALFVAAPVLAQPVPTTPPGQTPPAPAPTPTPTPAPPTTPLPDQAAPNDQPSWLGGVTDVTAEETATPGKLTISMARAIELAVKQHPTLTLARAAVDLAIGHVDQAEVVLHPTVTLAGTLGANSTPGHVCLDGMGNPIAGTICGGSFFSASESTGLTASAAWKITDFGVTRNNVHAAELSVDASGSSLASSTLDVRRGVEQAYLAAIAAHRLILVAESTVKSDEGHLDQAKRFVAAQAQDPIVVAQAQSALAAAKSALAQAQSTEAIALGNLRAAIGWFDPTRAPVVDPNWPMPAEVEPPQLAGLVETARAHRPDIVALDKLILASDASLTAAHDERRPTLAATATAFYGPNSQNWSPEPTWIAGITLSWLAWDGGKSAADVKVAHANLVTTIANRDQLLLTLTSTLESARAQIIANYGNVHASTEAVTAAQAALTLAEARYKQGLGSQIELADAQTAVTTAEGGLVTAEWQLADAWSQLRRATGQM